MNAGVGPNQAITVGPNGLVILNRDADFRDMVRADVQERLDAAEAIDAGLVSPGRSGGA